MPQNYQTKIYDQYYGVVKEKEKYACETHEFNWPKRIEFILKGLPVPLSGKILDAGCGDGILLAHLKKNFPDIEMYGIDISKVACIKSQASGIQAQTADLNQEIPFPNDSFDFLIAHETIEHLVDPDRFLEESFRVLKKGGYIIVTTPNLATWYFRIVFLFGFYPIFYELSTRNRRIGTGFLKHIIKNFHPVGHIRVFTAPALKDILKLYGFEVVSLKGAHITFPFPKIINPFYNMLDSFFSFFPSLSSNLLIIGRK